MVYDGFHVRTAEPSSCDRDCVAQKAEHIYYLALHRKRKSLLNPGLEDDVIRLLERSWPAQGNQERHL